MGELKIACHVCTWGSLTQSHWEPVFRQIAEAGYDGLEGLYCDSSEALVEMASAARKWGLEIVMVGARSPHQIIRYNAALGAGVAEIWEGLPADFGGPEGSDEKRFAKVAKYFEPFLEEAARYKIKLVHHVHLGQMVMTPKDLELFVKYIPGMGILFDTGHCVAGGHNPTKVLNQHSDRIPLVHLKDFRKAEGWDCYNRDFTDSYFVPLGEGKSGLDVKKILDLLAEKSYDGWVSCELDPLPSLMEQGWTVNDLIRKNREYVRSLGY